MTLHHPAPEHRAAAGHRPLQAAPWGVWLAALVLALAAVLAIVGMDVWWPGLPSLQAHYLNLERLARAQTDRPLVVALGDSKLRFALSFDQDFHTPAEGTPAALNLVRITWNNARPTDLMPALERLTQHPATVLLVQADLLLWQRPPLPLDAWLLARWAQNTARMRLWLGRTDAFWAADNQGLVGWMPTDMRQNPAAQQRFAQASAQWQLQPAAQQAVWLNKLHQLEQLGTRVVLLNMPRAPYAQALLPAATSALEQTALARLAASHAWPVWTPAPLSDAFYFDPGHMTPQGQQRYSAWLRKQLTQTLTQTLTQAQPAAKPADTR